MAQAEVGRAREAGVGGALVLAAPGHPVAHQGHMRVWVHTVLHQRSADLQAAVHERLVTPELPCAGGRLCYAAQDVVCHNNSRF